MKSKRSKKPNAMHKETQQLTKLRCVKGRKALNGINKPQRRVCHVIQHRGC